MANILSRTHYRIEMTCPTLTFVGSAVFESDNFILAGQEARRRAQAWVVEMTGHEAVVYDWKLFVEDQTEPIITGGVKRFW